MNDYLIKYHESLLLTDNQVEGIKTSIAAIKSKISDYYNNPDIKIFGSFNRKTIIKNDNADVDIMIVFGNDTKKPQTLLGHLKEFWAEEISQFSLFSDRFQQ